MLVLSSVVIATPLVVAASAAVLAALLAPLNHKRSPDYIPDRSSCRQSASKYATFS